MNARRPLAIPSLLLAALGMSACATFEGSPRRLLNESASMELVNLYKMDDAIFYFSQPDDAAGNSWREGLTRQQYRDMVVIVYMNAMDARYYEFRTMLSSERRQTNFALDLAVLGFTGWASVARESIVNNLSAVAAGFASARSSIDTNLYFNQTLPALIAAMDAQRLRARAQMMIRLRASAGDYPLPTAFADLMSYEVSSTLDTAISQITGDAAQDRQLAQQELAAATPACRAEEGAGEVAQRLVSYVEQYYTPDANGAVPPANLLKLATVASALGVQPGWTTAESLYDSIIRYIMNGTEGRCGKADLEAMITRVQSATREEIP